MQSSEKAMEKEERGFAADVRTISLSDCSAVLQSQCHVCYGWLRSASSTQLRPRKDDGQGLKRPVFTVH